MTYTGKIPGTRCSKTEMAQATQRLRGLLKSKRKVTAEPKDEHRGSPARSGEAGSSSSAPHEPPREVGHIGPADRDLKHWGTQKDSVFTHRGYGKVREELRLQVTNPSSPFNIVIMIVIFVATLTMVLETVPALDEYISEMGWTMIEASCVFIFTIELMIKLFVTPLNKWWSFFLSVTNLIDVVAILPFYLELFTSALSPRECWTGFISHDIIRGAYNESAAELCGDTAQQTSFTFLRAFRLARVMRVLKLGNFSAGVKVFTVAIMKSTPQLVAIFFFMMIAMIIFSSMMYYAETGCDEFSNNTVHNEQCALQKSHFQSIPATAWWCIVTMTTVGYGDMYPVTGLGQLIAVPTMLAGILIFALPITVIGSNYEAAFHNEVMRRLINELQAGIKQLFKTKNEITLADVQQLTKKWSSRWTADHAQLYERLELMWDMYDLALDGQLDGALSRRQMAKLIEDLRMQIEDNVQMQPGGPEGGSQRMLLPGEAGPGVQARSADDEPSAPTPPSLACRRGSGQADQRHSITSNGGKRNSLRQSAMDKQGVMMLTLLDSRVGVLEEAMGAQDAAIAHIGQSLEALAAALNVALPPPPLGSPGAKGGVHWEDRRQSTKRVSSHGARQRQRQRSPNLSTPQGAAVYIQKSWRNHMTSSSQGKMSTATAGTSRTR